jgi:hypothetical protein
MFRQISVVSTIEIEAPKSDVLEVIWDIKGIEKFEVKADRVEVSPLTPRKGTYKVRGRFAGVPWRREFAYFLNEDGFYSRDAHQTREHVTVQGGFIVQELRPLRSVLIHYELYYISLWFLPLRPLITSYLKWSMSKELRDIRDAVFSRKRQSAAA